MFLQPLITIPVIDSGLRFSQNTGMLTADEIREELIRQLGAGTLSGASVARKLSIAPARVTEMRNRTRRVQQAEMMPLATFLGMVENEPETSAVESVTYIPNLGKVAQGVWLEQSELDPDGSGFVVYDRLRGDPPPVDLFAVTPDGNSMNLRFMEGTQLICRRVPFGSGQYKSGDYVIAERTAHDLREMTVKRLEVDAEGNYWLHSESSDERFKEPWFIGKPDNGHFTDMEVLVVGKVIRAVQDFENG